MIPPAHIVPVLWIAWLVGWFLAARTTATTVRPERTVSRLAYSVPMSVGAALLFLHSARFGGLLRPLLPPDAGLAWLGLAAVAAGLGVTAWARWHLGRFWSAAVTLKVEHSLIRTGPYALTRHPIYSGILLALAGTVLVHDNLAGLVGYSLMLVGIVLKIRQEERLLTEHFGAAYRDYQTLVPALIPRLRSRPVGDR